MSRHIADIEQRRDAISPAGSFIVQAPAGSGKTELLIQRYLKLLSFVEHPEEVIAITFTRKAAAEMQGRIVNSLNRARNNVPPKDDATRLTDELAAEVLKQDRKYNWQLQDNPGRLRIQTIDSLCAWLTRQMPILSRFGAQPETIDDATELYLEAAANTLAELENAGSWSDDIAILLTHLDNDLPKVKNLLARMLARRDQWLRHVAKEINRDELEAALKHIVESTLATTRKAFPEAHIQEFLECLRYATKNLANEGSESLLVICQGIDHLPGITAIELPRWQAIVEICLTQKNEWRKRLDKNTGFPSTPEGKQMKDRFQALLAHLSEHNELLNQLQEVRQLPPFIYTNNEWQVINALCQLLILADAQLRVLFSERNQIDFTGITNAAIVALETQNVPTDLALHLDYQIKHLLIDEFQDVSTTQFKLVEQLTAGWSVDDGHTLFLVGDPMQSIYRFREAEVGLFITTWQEKRLAQLPLTPLNISVNFRSQAGIVNWVNDTFKQVLPEKADSAHGAVSYVQAEAFHQEKTKDAVRIHALINRDDNIEMERVISLVNSVREKDPNGTIAILVRNRTHLLHIVPGLKQAGLRFKAVEIEELRHRAEIQDLLALTMALNHFADRIAWFAILRAPWCGLTLSDLFSLAGKAKDKTIWECMQDDNRLKSLSVDGQRRLLKLRAVLQLGFAEQRRRSLRRTVESVWMSLGGPATLQDETDLENVRTYFDLLEQYDNGGELRFREQFIENVTKLFAAPDVHAGNELQIMTMHKAKGLEFDAVILPGLDRIGRQDESQLLIWSENPHHMHQDLLLAPIKEAGQKMSPIYDYVKRLEKQKQNYEAGRLIYVAATRARKQLHLLGSVNVNADGEIAKPDSRSLLAQLWPAVTAEFEKEFKNYQPSITLQADAKGVRSNKLRRLTPGWTLAVSPDPAIWQEEMAQAELPEALPEYEWAGETIRLVGIVVHRFIQIMAEDGVADWDIKAIKSKRPVFEGALKRLGVKEKDLVGATDNVEDALTKLVKDKRGQWLLSPEHTDQHNEYELSGIYQNRVINIKIDRTFIDEEGTRWIVDYKTSPHKGPDLETFLAQEEKRYRPQLEKYGTLMQSIDNRPVRLGLYFPLLQSWQEISFNKI